MSGKCSAGKFDLFCFQPVSADYPPVTELLSYLEFMFMYVVVVVVL